MRSDTQRFIDDLTDVREQTHSLLSSLGEKDLTRIHSPIMSPLAWDLGHIAAYEDLWLCHRLGGMSLLRPDLAEIYDAFETPRSQRGEIEMLGPTAAAQYLADVRARTIRTLTEVGIGDGVICEMVIRHELQHRETMLQTMTLAGLTEEPISELIGESSAQDGGWSRDSWEGEWVSISPGDFWIGALTDGFSYDNERPSHLVSLAAFEIARRPVTGASWMGFDEEGGYERREWWSPEGWAWKERHDITPHPSIVRGDPRAPVCHVSFFEAEAFAASVGTRLPTEIEWEVAAATKRSELEGVGTVWEWTSSHFEGYPGFVAHPYREYSEVFFGGDYRVLRGGSWATSERVASVTFRNWDRPIRRQIFSGLRLARDR